MITSMTTYIARYCGEKTEDGGEEIITAETAEQAVQIACKSALSGDWVTGERIRIIIAMGDDDVADTYITAP